MLNKRRYFKSLAPLDSTSVEVFHQRHNSRTDREFAIERCGKIRTVIYIFTLHLDSAHSRRSDCFPNLGERRGCLFSWNFPDKLTNYSSTRYICLVG